MINERSSFVRRPHHQFDRYYNPNSKLSPPTHHAAMDWAHAGDPSSLLYVQPQFIPEAFTPAPSPSYPSSSALAACPSSSPLPLLPPSAPGGSGGQRFRHRVSEATASREAAAMRDSYNRTKVVVRHLPPTLSESIFMEQIASRIAGTYNMVSFCPGKPGTKDSKHARAYIDFKHPEDVINFCQEFNGHVFVNEKGTQYKALVEYAPYQRVPKSWQKKDSREGLIFEDPEYLKFVEQISKPVESLPSAEVQLERKEAERNTSLVGATKDAIIVTPLMEYVRQKRALKSAPQKSAAGKGSARGGSSLAASSKVVLRRGADTRANSMYSAGGPRQKEKATYVPRYDENQRHDATPAKLKGRMVPEKSNQDTSLPDKNGVEQLGSRGTASGKKAVSGPEKEELINGGNSVSSSDGKSGFRNNRGIKSPLSSLLGEDSSLSNKGSGGGRLGRGASLPRSAFLLSKLDQSSDRERLTLRNPVGKLDGRESELDSGSAPYISTEDKSELPRQDGRRLRNKDRPDRPVWTPRQRADPVESAKTSVAGQSGSLTGSHRPGRSSRDLESNTVPDSNKPSGKRGGGTSGVYGGHDKQVWVAKPGSGS